MSMKLFQIFILGEPLLFENNRYKDSPDRSRQGFQVVAQKLPDVDALGRDREPGGGKSVPGQESEPFNQPSRPRWALWAPIYNYGPIQTRCDRQFEMSPANRR